MQLHRTKDGSTTLYSEQFGQFYHNPNGAVSESRHVFFETPGVYEALKEATTPLSFFEMGFGTGLNYLLLLEACAKFNPAVPISFFSVEAFPVSPAQAQQFNFEGFLAGQGYSSHLAEVFESLTPGWNKAPVFGGSTVQLFVFFGDFASLTPPQESVQFVFHDPFSPEVSPQLWTPETFEKIRRFSTPDAVLATYSAASKARAALAKAGWRVARAPGALGKREMTLASLQAEKLDGFKRVNESRLCSRWDAGDFNG